MLRRGVYVWRQYARSLAHYTRTDIGTLSGAPEGVLNRKVRQARESVFGWGVVRGLHYYSSENMRTAKDASNSVELITSMEN